MLQCAPQGQAKATSGQLLLAHTSPEGKSITTVGWSNWAESTHSRAQTLATSPGRAPNLALVPAAWSYLGCKHGPPTTQACKSREQPTDSQQLSITMLAHLPLLCLDIDSKSTAASLPWGMVTSRHGKSRDPIENKGGSISKLIKQLVIGWNVWEERRYSMNEGLVALWRWKTDKT